MSGLIVDNLNLKAGDALLVYTPTGYTKAQADTVCAELAKVFPDHPAIVLASGWSVDRLSREELEDLLALSRQEAAT